MFKVIGFGFIGVVGAMLTAAHITPGIDAKMNPVIGEQVVVYDTARALHETLYVADLHADMLLWDREHRARLDFGQTDMARFAEGSVDLQIFSVVTASPKGQNFDANSIESGDQITTLALAQGWPLATLGSIRARAVHQAERLHGLERAGELTIVRTASDLDAPGLKGILLIEGAHPLEGKLSNIDRLYDAGFRVMGLQHFFDNRLGGSMHGQSQAGLTDFGRDAVARMNARGVIIDLAHSSEAVARDVLAMSEAPVMISHTGLRLACPGTDNRNLPDDVMVEIARGGGLIGIAYFKGAICEISADGIADTIVTAVELVGPGAVALGSDFDGTVATSLDTAQLARITQALLARGMDEAVIAKVMGQNAERFFRDNLPDGN
jgi:microsomal dipeptidase-like Zn-dependent dipeptidase